MKRLFILLALFLLFVKPVLADVYIKSRVMNGMSESEMWTSGKKQRMVMQAPMAGEIVTITRADKEVTWEIHPSLKSYTEKPIPIPYTAEEKSKMTPEEAEEQKQMDEMLSKADQPQTENDCKSVKVSGERIFAGIKAEGYQGVCKGEQNPSSILWMAAANEDKAAKMQKELTAFEEARVDSMYSKYPAKERERTKKLMLLMGKAMAQGMMGIPVSKNMPQRMALAMESLGNGQEKSVMMEVTAADWVGPDASRYEIPAGFTKVENMEALQSQQMMAQFSNGNTNLADLMKGAGNTAQKMEGAPDSDSPEDQNPQGMEALNREIQNAQANQGTVPYVPPPTMPAQVLQGQAPSTAQLRKQFPTSQPEPWQQGLYDQTQPVSAPPAVPPPQYVPGNPIPPQSQGGYPPVRRRQQNSTQGTLQEVNKALENVRGITDQLNGGGIPDFNQGNSLDSYADQDSGDSDNSSDQTGY